MREILTKTIMNYNYINIRMAKNDSDNTKHGKNSEKADHSFIAGRNMK
jgi:hypothetical protein